MNENLEGKPEYLYNSRLKSQTALSRIIGRMKGANQLVRQFVVLRSWSRTHKLYTSQTPRFLAFHFEARIRKPAHWNSRLWVWFVEKRARDLGMRDIDYVRLMLSKLHGKDRERSIFWMPEDGTVSITIVGTEISPDGAVLWSRGRLDWSVSVFEAAAELVDLTGLVL